MIRSDRSLEGYFMIDHRASPGLSETDINTLPAHMRIPAIREGQVLEAAVLTCSHCHTQILVNPDRTRPRNKCFKCARYICDKPECNVKCLNLNAFLDALQNKAAQGYEITPTVMDVVSDKLSR